MEDFTNVYLTGCYNIIDASNLRPLRATISLFTHYIKLIRRWNLKVNLISFDNVENLWKKHLKPSLKPLELNLIPLGAVILDAGSGAGLPGIPLKILRPDIYMYLCEAQRKKALFLQEAIEVLKLEKASVINDRVENLNGKYNMILSRAMGKPETIVPLLSKLLNANGKLLIWTAKASAEAFPDFKVESYDIEDGGKLLVLSLWLISNLVA